MNILKRLPQETINLIVEVYEKSKTQNKQPKSAITEILDILPPREVQKVVLAELGIIGNIAPNIKAEAARWMSCIGDVQTRAEQVIAKLYEIEPPSSQSARLGSLPGWIVEQWAPYLNFAWSFRLPESLKKAEEYLESRGAQTGG